VRAAVGEVTMVCPICDHEDTHTCKDNRVPTIGGK
jgi:hypothetical protein